MDFETRYKKLNDAQRQAVDTIEGPLMVIAGPGTGKTELLSMRAANILKQTDALPGNILCLTFTESGAAAMRERLTEIIGKDAYKVAIHTFHSFGSDVIGRYGDYFYQGANFRPADEMSVYKILRGIFDELDYDNPLASTMNGEYTHLSDAISTISELKKSGLTSDELLAIIDDNERVLDAVEKDLAAIFEARIAKTTKDQLRPVALAASKLAQPALPPAITPLGEILSLSLLHAIDEADDTDSTKPVTAWRNEWMEKNADAKFVFKDRRRHAKLRALSFIYYQYLTRMQERELYDFDDMVLRVVHALEVFDELRFNLQEQYQYIMVDEFQDTNLAQARLLRSLTSNPALEGSPNIMVVGDDDQAIYSFQGAEISNIMQFKGLYASTKLVALTDNYRSTADILERSRGVIGQGSERLERFIPELDKTLTAHRAGKEPTKLYEFATATDERAWLARTVKTELEHGTKASEITVIARRHGELINLLPFFAAEGVGVNYERRDNVLDSQPVRALELAGRVVQLIATGRQQDADALLPELLAHPAFGIEAAELWRLSLDASKRRVGWLEAMADNEIFAPIGLWLAERAKESRHQPLEPMLDRLIGLKNDDKPEPFVAPFYEYFFGEERRAGNADEYLVFLEALRTIRHRLRDYSPNDSLRLDDFLEFIDLHRRLGQTITSVRVRPETLPDRINLMTAHKSKGLEFGHVYIYGAIDSMWGERVRVRSRSIGYPENLPLQSAGDTADERLRLFFVAMTRAKSRLTISYSLLSDNDSATLPASFLTTGDLTAKTMPSPDSTEVLVRQTETEWYQPLLAVAPPTMKELLAPTLENYKLSASHLTSFLDVSRGGPQAFLLGSLLDFPQAPSPMSAYGQAMHQTLQQAHKHLRATKKRRPIEDVVHDFDTNLTAMRMDKADYDSYHKRGSAYLQQFLAEHYQDFNERQQAELDFGYQESRLGTVRMSGRLDLAEFDDAAKTVIVTDYKTGKPSKSFKGTSDYEKSKLQNYLQQLMFYKLLVEHSRDYGGYEVVKGIIQFVEPAAGSAVFWHPETDFPADEMERFSQLVTAVWQHIINLDLPDTSAYQQNFSGRMAFEQDLLDGKV